MSKTIEREWTTEASLPARRIRFSRSGPPLRFVQQSWINGYVGVPDGHPLHGLRYSDQTPLITSEMADRATLGQKSPLLAFTAGCRSDGDGLVRRSLDVVIDCHGGLTYSNVMDDAPGIWWFGFDTTHCDDAENPKDEAFVDAQCESIARQIVELVSAGAHA